MNLKIHLVIIAMIVVIIYVVRSFLEAQQHSPAAIIIKGEAVSAYSISIVHASWGLNCVSMFKYMNQQAGTSENNDLYAQNSYIDLSKIKEDNVLVAVSNLCNGKSSCDIGINTNALGDDPLPSCGSKVLQVDYRCFEVDKLRGARVPFGSMTIDCDKQMAK
jgi:hypothetical protein